MHCDDQELLRLSEGKAGADAAEHVHDCAVCRERLEELTFDQLLEDPETHRLAEELSGGSERLSENIRIAQLSADEDEEAEERLRPYLRNPARFGWSGFLRSPQHRTAGTVRILCRAANQRCEQKPLEARVLADSAAAIAEGLSTDHYLGMGIYLLRGLAWKERGNARHALGDFAGALDSFDRALRAYGYVEEATLERAIVNYCRGRTFSQTERFDRALDVLTESEAEFVRRGDTGRYIDCRLEIGNTHFRKGNTAEAVGIWQALGAHAEASDDALLFSRVSNNLGWAHLRLTCWTDAAAAFQRALEGFVRLGRDTQAVRSRWGLARVMVEIGDTSRGLEALERSRQECERYRMLDDAMLVSLDLADALLGAGRADDCARLCKSLVRHFRQAGLQTSALRALEYLRTAALRKTVSHGVIGFVREFIERLAANPTLRFVPPATS
jgi:tetratricopeptide (TPR) repeat protein